MSTTKTIKIQKNKILTYSINKSGFQTINKTLKVTDNTTINENMVSQTSSPIQQLGDRFLGISSYVCDFTPSGEYDVDSLKYLQASQTVGSNLSQIQVVKSLWLTQIETVLGIETPQGTSRNFAFVYDGVNDSWSCGSVIQNITTQKLADVYGVSFVGTPLNGDTITVTETYYNKFAVYVLDSNYRSNQKWCSSAITVMPKQYSSNPQDCIESATYYNQYAFDNFDLSQYPIFDYCKSKGNFLLPNGIKINALIPNSVEIQAIWNNKVELDSFDPVIQGGSTSFNLTNWAFSGNRCWTCLEKGLQKWLFTSNQFLADNANSQYGTCPVFEVPVM